MSKKNDLSDIQVDNCPPAHQCVIKMRLCFALFAAFAVKSMANLSHPKFLIQQIGIKQLRNC
jgi:hypothetical protein